jgi:NRPS condensation-like uncharacterized protein
MTEEYFKLHKEVCESVLEQCKLKVEELWKIEDQDEAREELNVFLHELPKCYVTGVISTEIGILNEYGVPFEDYLWKLKSIQGWNFKL